MLVMLILALKMKMNHLMIFIDDLHHAHDCHNGHYDDSEDVDDMDMVLTMVVTW